MRRNISILCTDPGQIWDLQQVCARWRNLVQNTPILWCNLKVGSRGVVVPAMVKKPIKTCLKFSRATLLSIILLPKKSSTLYPIFEAIAVHAPRWKSLTIEGLVIYCTLRMAAAWAHIDTKEGLPQLRTLNIIGVQKSDFQYVFQGAVALEEVSLTLSAPPNSCYFPWTNDKRLAIENFEADPEFTGAFEIGSIFCEMPLLEKLKWKFNRHEFGSIPPVIYFPALHILDIEDSTELYELLPKLRVPSLARLRVVDDIEDVNPLISMIKLSSCVITQLQLCLQSTTAMLQLFKELHALEELSLLRGAINHDVLGKLIWSYSRADQENTNPSPSLKRLDLLGQQEYLEEIPMNCLYCLSYIISSRSLVSISNTITGRRVPPSTTPLFVKFSMDAHKDSEEFDGMVCHLKRVGAESGTEIEWEIRRRTYKDVLVKSVESASSCSSSSTDEWTYHLLSRGSMVFLGFLRIGTRGNFRNLTLSRRLATTKYLSLNVYQVCCPQLTKSESATFNLHSIFTFAKGVVEGSNGKFWLGLQHPTTMPQMWLSDRNSQQGPPSGPSHLTRSFKPCSKSS
ncbi:hypothetical protein BDQ17DRAFT_489689 [Cyathus striatus]|nr:hypothetical protein BDQ17DRAFT_489689 [Cyathus striatus]